MGILDFFRKKSGSRPEETEYDPIELADDEHEELEPVAKQPVKETADGSGFARTYCVELLYAERPELDKGALLAKMREYTGEVTMQETRGAGHDAPVRMEWGSNGSRLLGTGTLQFHHERYASEYEDGHLPGQIFVSIAAQEPDAASYEYALQQSWHWPEARETIAVCRHKLLLSDFCTSKLAYKQRLELFERALRALLEIAPCEAIVWKGSEKVVHPGQYVQALDEGQRLFGAMNIRLYKMDDGQQERSEMLVDTCGLAAFGLPDVQCHFYDMDPNEVASVLGDFGKYLFEAGDDFEDGETIDVSEQRSWKLRHTHALAEPPRHVIDLDPGSSHYAGK